MFDVLKRNEIAHYLNTASQGEPEDFNLVGVGAKAFNKNYNAESKTRRYIIDSSNTTTVASYSPSYELDADLIKDQAVIGWFQNVADQELTGDDAITDVVDVYLYQPEGTANTFKAQKRKFSFVANAKPDNDGELGLTGTMSSVGDFINGTFSTETKTFSPAE